MRWNVASVDQVLYSWRHRGKRDALNVAKQRVLALIGRPFFTFRYPTVEWGPNVTIESRVILRGTGTVVLGRGVTFWGFAREPAVLVTNSAAARIEIGERTRVSGAVIVAAGSITIGRRCIIAECRMTDNDWHPIGGDRQEIGGVTKPQPIVIEDNVWIADQAIICKGVTIGANSVIGAGAVVRTSVPPNSIVIGNPEQAQPIRRETPAQ